MATETEKLKLSKPAGGDYVDVGVLNENFDKIDQFAQDVEDGYLPLTGGVLSGNLRIVKNLPEIVARSVDGSSNYFNLVWGNDNTLSFYNRNMDGRFNCIYINPIDFANPFRYSIRDEIGGNVKHGNLLGEHNFVISATTASDDMDVYMKQGAHFKWYRTGSNTLNTPYKKGLTGGYLASVIMSYATSTTVGKQIAYISGTDKVYVRYMNNDNPNVISDWQELGGGLMSPVKVTRHTASGSYSGTGKGKLFFNAETGYTTSISSVVIDGVSIGTLSDMNYSESFEIDFTKSYSFTINTSNASNSRVTAVFY